jgi:hypothetical protein
MADLSGVVAWLALGVSTVNAGYTAWSKKQEPIRRKQRQMNELVREAVHPILRDCRTAINALENDDGIFKEPPDSFESASVKLDKYDYVLTSAVKAKTRSLRDLLANVDTTWRAFRDIDRSEETDKQAADRQALIDSLDHIYNLSNDCLALTARLDEK